jgi:hypothetical protein
MYRPAATPSNPAPAPVHLSPNDASSGVITITGSNLGATGCTAAVTIGGATFAHPASGSNTLTIALTPAQPLAAAASGAVAVLLTDALGGTNSSNTGSVRVFNLIQTPAATAQDLAPVEGSTENVLGNALTPFASTAHGGLAGASMMGTYSSCYGPAQQFAATVAATATGSGRPPSYDRALQVPAPTVYCDGALALGFTAPYYDDPAPAVNSPDCHATHPQDCIQLTVDADPTAPIDVAFAVASVGPVSVSAGQVVTVSGTGFGPSGQAAIGGVAASASWSDRSVRVTVPAGVSTGHLIIQRLTGDRQRLDLGTIAVAGPVSTAVRGPGVAAGTANETATTGEPSASPEASPAAHDGLTRAADSAQASPAPGSSAGGVNLPFGLGPLDIKVTGNPLVVWMSVATAILVALGVLVNLEVLRRYLWAITGARLIARWRSPRTA